MLKTPAETVEIGGSESQLAFTFLDKEPFGKLLHQPFDNIGGAVGRVVLDNQHIELFLEREYLANDILYIFLLIVCRSDYKCV